MINGIAAVVYLIVVLIFALTEFTSGAWVVVVVMPLIIFGLMRTNAQYRAEDAVLANAAKALSKVRDMSTEKQPEPEPPVTKFAHVPGGRPHRRSDLPPEGHCRRTHSVGARPGGARRNRLAMLNPLYELIRTSADEVEPAG